MTRRILFFLLTWLLTNLFSLPVWAQRGTTSPNIPPAEVRGQVRLANNQIAPVGIMVLLVHQQGDTVMQSQTDSSGKFEFRSLPPAVYRVRIHSPGYLDYESEDLYMSQNPMVYLNPVLRVDPNYKNPFASATPGGVVSVESLNIPEGARNDLESGKALLEKGSDYPKSVELFKSAIKAYPKYSEAYLMMGLAYRAQNKLDEAASALRKCIEIKADSAPAYTALGEIQNEEKDYPGAEKNLLKAVTLNPDSPPAQAELGRTYLSERRFDEAEPHVAKALALAPQNSLAHLLMGNLFMHKRNGQAALVEYQQYLKLEPQGPMAPAVADMVNRLEKALAQAQGQPQNR